MGKQKGQKNDFKTLSLVPKKFLYCTWNHKLGSSVHTTSFHKTEDLPKGRERDEGSKSEI